MRFVSKLFRPSIVAAILAAFSFSAHATTFVEGDAVTGSASPGSATQVSYNILNNWTFVVVGVLPVVASVSGNPASIVAAVDASGTAFSGVGQIYVGQWTVVSTSAGIQASPAYQAISPLNLVNNSGSAIAVRLRCSVGNMTGSCIFMTRMTPSTDPVF